MDPQVRKYLHVRDLCRRSLYDFLIVCLGRTYLQGSLHRRVCEFIQSDVNEALLLLARDHCKSTIVSQGLPLHILIQEPETNCYFPGEWGCEQRVLVLGSGDDVVADHIGSVRQELESNETLRFLFPEICWPDPRKPGVMEDGSIIKAEWNDNNLTVPRKGTWPNPSIGAKSVGGSLAGWRPTFLVFDDVIGEREANSPSHMRKAIRGYTTADALLGRAAKTRTIGTPWTLDDLYASMREDPAVAKLEIPAIVMPDGEEWETLDDAFERGRVVYTKGKNGWTKEKLKRRREKWYRDEGSDLLFSLMMMLRASGDAATDFAGYMPWREYEVVDGERPSPTSRVVFSEVEHDERLGENYLGEWEPGGEARFSDMQAITYCDPASCRPKQELVGMTARSAIVTALADSATRIYVVEAWAKRCSVEELVERLFETNRRWGGRIGIEGVYMQNLFAGSIGMIHKERRAQDPAAYPPMNVFAVDLPRGVDKTARIKAILQPAFATGRMLFHPPTQAALYRELRAFPRGRLVDMVDALAQVVTMSPRKRMVSQIKEDEARYREVLRDEGLPDWAIREAERQRESEVRPARRERERVPTHAPDGRVLDPAERRIERMRRERRRARR